MYDSNAKLLERGAPQHLLLYGVRLLEWIQSSSGTGRGGARARDPSPLLQLLRTRLPPNCTCHLLLAPGSKDVPASATCRTLRAEVDETFPREPHQRWGIRTDDPRTIDIFSILISMERDSYRYLPQNRGRPGANPGSEPGGFRFRTGPFRVRTLPRTAFPRNRPW